ncbi:hypothetical protein BGZ94_000930 [Podila epigama]|nr:hypothetical protein BGZ94_000930 [Podila epigama]
MHSSIYRSCLGIACILSLASALPASSSSSSSPASLPASASIHSLTKRAVKFVEPSEPQLEVTFHSTNANYKDILKLNGCSNSSRPLNTQYTSISTTDHQSAINFYLDDECTEYDFSVLSEYDSYAGEFASFKYVGQYLDAEPGFYENLEFSPTNVPDQETEHKAPQEPQGQPKPQEKPVAKPQEQQQQQGGGGTRSFGFIVGVGLVSLLTLAGLFSCGWYIYNKHIKDGGRSKRSFMTLSTGRDDYDDEVGLTGENGPHSSALMQSRVGVSFDDERFPAAYHDEDNAEFDKEDNRVELGAYPQNPTGPTQYRDEPGTLPQNRKNP